MNRGRSVKPTDERRASHAVIHSKRTFIGAAALGAVGMLLAPKLSVAAARPTTKGGYLVAHRGGVVDALRGENSLAAMDEAIRRGYSHVEVDLRSTRDGVLVCLHDRSLQRTTGAAINVDEVTLAELHARVDPAIVPTLDAYCTRAAGRIALMPDVKGSTPELEVGMSGKIRATLEAHGLYSDALFIGRGHIINGFVDDARIAWRDSYEAFEAAVPRSRFGNYFAFDHAQDFDRRTVSAFQAAGVPVIITVNTAHYHEGDPVAQGEAAIRLAHDMGVDGFQIDAVYEPLVRFLSQSSASR